MSLQLTERQYGSTNPNSVTDRFSGPPFIDTRRITSGQPYPEREGSQLNRTAELDSAILGFQANRAVPALPVHAAPSNATRIDAIRLRIMGSRCWSRDCHTADRDTGCLYDTITP